MKTLKELIEYHGHDELCEALGWASSWCSATACGDCPVNTEESLNHAIIEEMK
jgi:hypothetical protein